MSDDKVVTLGAVAVLIGFFLFCAHGCETEAVKTLETQRIRGTSQTVTTCIEHSVLDRVQVVQ